MTNETPVTHYPSLRQSWGIVGMAILFTLLFIPVDILLGNLASSELSFLVCYVGSMGAAFWYAHNKRKASIVRAYRIDNVSIKAIVLVSVSAIAIQTGIISPLVSMIPMPEFMKDIFLELSKDKGAFTFVSVVIAAPILEELIFRGIILDGLLTRYSPMKSIVLSSFLFGILHLNPWQFITAFIIGLLAGWVYYETRSLTLSILTHLANNLFAYVFMHFIDVEASMNQSLSDYYGGYLNFILITAGAIMIAVIALYLLRLDLKSLPASTIPEVKTDEVEGS